MRDMAFALLIAGGALGGVACGDAGSQEQTADPGADGGGNPANGGGGPGGSTPPPNGDPDGGGTPPPPDLNGPPSCKGTLGTAGVTTCGSEAKPETCCRALPLPKTQKRSLDRYEITSGRVRAFVTAVPDIRAFAKAQAAANPQSQLGTVAAKFAGLLDVLPAAGDPALPVHLGAFTLDPINALDGCFVGPNAFGHATYWQEEAALSKFGVPARKYSREVLDAKPMNCVMPLMLATFCAWDGGELARTSDYREVWGTKTETIGTAKVEIPWAALLNVGEFNWRNGKGGACPIAWPGCKNPPEYFFRSPAANHNPSADDSPAIAEPGRFAKDVTAAMSANDGWFDVAGNLMEAAWPNAALDGGANEVTGVCDTTEKAGAGQQGCTRRNQTGVRRFAGALPQIALVGYSFEGHSRRSEDYLGSADGDEKRILPGDVKPVTFQYGKVGGRCARVIP